MDGIDTTVTLAQAVLLVFGAALFVADALGAGGSGGVDLSTIGIALYGIAFAVAAGGSVAAGDGTLAGTQAATTLGFLVVLAATVAGLGDTVAGAGALVVGASVIAQVLLMSSDRDGNRDGGHPRL